MFFACRDAARVPVDHETSIKTGDAQKKKKTKKKKKKKNHTQNNTHELNKHTTQKNKKQSNKNKQRKKKSSQGIFGLAWGGAVEKKKEVGLSPGGSAH